MPPPDVPESDELTAEQREHVASLLDWMQKTLGVERAAGFVENDWMMIVKFHAMIETALNQALVRQFTAPELSGVIAKLDTSNTAIGKVAFSKALQILHPASVVFIQKLSELRNLCVHDVRNFDFKIEKYLKGLTDQKRSELTKPIMKVVKPEFRKSTPLREALYVGTMQVMMELQVHDLQCKGRDLRLELHRRGYERWKEHEQSSSKTE